MDITLYVEIIVPQEGDHFLNSHYPELPENDKNYLINNCKDAIYMCGYRFTDNEENIIIRGIDLYEDNNKLYAKIDIYDENPHEYTANKMKKLVEQRCDHHMRAGEGRVGSITVNFCLTEIEEYHNQVGTDKTFHNITCHPFYTIGYDKDDEELVVNHYNQSSDDEMINDSINFYNQHGMYRCNIVKVKLYNSGNNELLRSTDLYYDRNENQLITA